MKRSCPQDWPTPESSKRNRLMLNVLHYFSELEQTTKDHIYGSLEMLLLGTIDEATCEIEVMSFCDILGKHLLKMYLSACNDDEAVRLACTVAVGTCDDGKEQAAGNR